MIYTVLWTKTVNDQLAKIWNVATDRHAVTDAGDRIDPILRNDPETKGTPFGSFYVLDLPPLAVLYDVDPGDRKVHVLAIKRV